MCIVTEVYPDKNGVVRNVEIKVAPRCEGSSKYKPQVLYKLKRHVSKLIVITTVEENKESIDQHSLYNEEVNSNANQTDNNQLKLESSKSGPNC